jgi:hypothetical protein
MVSGMWVLLEIILIGAVFLYARTVCIVWRLSECILAVCLRSRTIYKYKRRNVNLAGNLR